ncbi:UNVERIFIED_CONTAM: hypothetical protein DES50_12117 [Williamsia faeni]
MLYPNEILRVSRGRYLTTTGKLLSQDDRKYGDPTDLKDNTRCLLGGEVCKGRAHAGRATALTTHRVHSEQLVDTYEEAGLVTFEESRDIV